VPLKRELAIAATLFAAMCVAVLVRAPQLLEPDDYAYRASIVALSEGHVLLTNAQYLALYAQLSAHGGGGIFQWVHLAGGRWISQKNPGYPFLAVVFQWLHALRWAPLFYGALACAGLFYGARRWLGRWGGVYAVGAYCFSGVALSFAWRATMSTFTDASLIACGAGLLLGVLLSRNDSAIRRATWGTLAFVALELAVLVRYTDVAVLIVAVVAVLALYRACSLTRSVLFTWLASVAVFAVGDLVLNRALYGGFLTSGYQSGLITFAVGAIGPNVERMPVRLVESMPVWLLALASIGWVATRYVRARDLDDASPGHARARLDAVVVMVLGLGWASVWGLYATYTWTVAQTNGPGNPEHVVRFYVPVLGLLALLAAWLLTHLGRRLPVALLAVLVGTALWSYQTPANRIIAGRPSAHVGPPQPYAPPIVSNSPGASMPALERSHHGGSLVRTARALNR